MNRIAALFEKLRQEKRTALMPYLCMGYPERDSALDLVPALVRGGADLIELGVPYSDPLADGATIQAASQRALENGMSLARCLEQVAALRAGTPHAAGIDVPLLLMGYYNPLLQMGLDAFVERAHAAGVDGLIVPDLPPEEADELQEALRAREIDLVYLLAPTSDEPRIHQVAARGSGFLYLVSLVGVTGARDRLPPELEAFIARVRAASELPLAVGFGIGTPAQARRVAAAADGVIVGSALIRAIGSAHAAGCDAVQAAEAFVASLRAGIDST